jgi:hypothetical protein
MKSETPRTDAFQVAVIKNITLDDSSHWYDTAQKTADFTRQLERELNERNSLIRELLTYNLPGEMHEKLMRVASPPNEKS